MAYFWWKSDLTGGGADDLDGIDGDSIAAGDICVVTDTTNKFIRIYVSEAVIGEAESSPAVILPDDNPGTKGWRQYRVFASGLFQDSETPADTAPVVTGDLSFALGDEMTMAGDYCAVVGGYGHYIEENISVADYSAIYGGDRNYIDSALYSIVAGGARSQILDGSNYAAIFGGNYNFAYEPYTSVSGGLRAKAHIYGMEARANGYFNNTGDAQRSGLIARGITTDASATEIFIDGSSIQAILPASRSWRFSIDLVARQTAGTSGTVGDSAFWTITGGIKRDASNNTALIGTPAGTGTPGAADRDAAAAAWSVAVTADDTTEALSIDVTGEADKTIHWVAKMSLVEVG